MRFDQPRRFHFVHGFYRINGNYVRIFGDSFDPMNYMSLQFILELRLSIGSLEIWLGSKMLDKKIALFKLGSKEYHFLLELNFNARLMIEIKTY